MLNRMRVQLIIIGDGVLHHACSLQIVGVTLNYDITDMASKSYAQRSMCGQYVQSVFIHSTQYRWRLGLPDVDKQLST